MDRTPLKEDNFLKKILESLYANKEYISNQLSALIFDQGLHMATVFISNMKNIIMTTKGKILLRKRSVIEAINNQLKKITQADHYRHRSFGDLITN